MLAVTAKCLHLPRHVMLGSITCLSSDAPFSSGPVRDPESVFYVIHGRQIKLYPARYASSLISTARFWPHGPPSPRGSHSGVIPIGRGELLEGGGFPFPGEWCEPPGQGIVPFQTWPHCFPTYTPVPPPTLGPTLALPPEPPVNSPPWFHVPPADTPPPQSAPPPNPMPLSGPASIFPGATPPDRPAEPNIPAPGPVPP